MSDSIKFDWQRRILRSDLPAGQKLTALVLSVYADPDGGTIHPGVDRLTSDLSRSEATVERHLAALKNQGWIHQIRRGGRAKGGRSWASLYRVRYPGHGPALSDEGEVLGEGSTGAKGALHQVTSEPPPTTTLSTPTRRNEPAPSAAQSTPHLQPEHSQPDQLRIDKVTKLGNGMREVIYSNGWGQKLDYKPTEPTPWAQKQYEKSLRSTYNYL